MDGTDFAGRLLPGERIAWSGEAGRGLLLSPQDVYLIPFSLAWCGFAVFWRSRVSETNAPYFFELWGDMFVCIGLYFVLGRFFVDAWVRRWLRYAVTDQRVLIARTGLLPSFTAISLARVGDVSLHERRDGRGTVRFGEDLSTWRNRGLGAMTPALGSTPQLIAIADASRVYNLIQRNSQSLAQR